MKRIDTSTRAVDLFGAGKDGYKDGNKALGIVPTDMNASSLNSIQEEIASVIEGTGVALNPADNAQLSTAIKALIANYGNDYIAKFTTTANINLNGLAAQAGGDWSGALTAGDVILVKDQTTGAQNGWYVAAAGAWSRVTWADVSAEIKPAVLTMVSGGATLADSIWILTTDAPITLGTTSLVFARKDGGAVTAASDPTFVNNSSSPASTSWVRGAMAAIATAAGFAVSLTANGYIKFPSWLGGWIVQWATGTNDAANNTEVSQTITWPLAFPTAALFSSVSTQTATLSGSCDLFYQSAPPTLTNIQVQRNQTGSASSNSVLTAPKAWAVGY
ncbi:hypothetical protein C3Y98_04710 [Methylotenera oryzisoli]|uniref:Putative tail fiber protein gp53-like C-terminal domain-containing protein n=1 Tax=Methylotenera oryzisoli TaxID=2080758 RepID=A0A4Y9VRG7_9PROT|nr:hypothetical protein [Methylotenera oryzisoli]TFW71410.1 hypothetical protein C3Y98_04710 [Methylotenera oryzisoli]